MWQDEIHALDDIGKPIYHPCFCPPSQRSWWKGDIGLPSVRSFPLNNLTKCAPDPFEYHLLILDTYRATVYTGIWIIVTKKQGKIILHPFRRANQISTLRFNHFCISRWCPLFTRKRIKKCDFIISFPSLEPKYRASRIYEESGFMKIYNFA